MARMPSFDRAVGLLRSFQRRPHLPTLEHAADLRRQALKIEGFQYLSSDPLYADLFEYICSNKGRGRGIVEVGCFRGGTSILMSYLCQAFRWPFYIVDVNPENLKFTEGVLRRLKLNSTTRTFLGTFEQFAASKRLREPLALVFIDGDHSYDAVVKDCRALFRLNHRPRAAAFHDFCLRSHNASHGSILVDEAIYDCFGRDAELRRIGLQFDENPHWSADNPAPDGCYWYPHGSEGVIIDLDRHGLRQAA